MARSIWVLSVVFLGQAATCFGEVPFRRGDANADGGVDLSDGIQTLLHLFGALGRPACPDSFDSDDSGALEVTDAIWTLSYLFTGGAAPPAPGVETCGLDPTDDGLPCTLYDACKGDCASSADCPGTSYCAKADGDCDGIGVCTVRPEICPRILDPVCGCDGVTYTNDCEAARTGVSVAVRGPCEAAPCATSKDCAEDSYCRKVEGACDGLGTCEARPGACPDNWDPVCGCDGRTYSNACDAAAAGVNIVHPGECATACADNVDCPDGSYCHKADGDCEGIGACKERPTRCLTNWNPVCGCDGITYSNECAAAAAGINVASRGECGPAGCAESAGCPEDSYCRKDIGDCDGIGLCEVRPSGCPKNLDPVCGCDGVTYGNACEAARAGVNVLHAGECK